MTANEITLLIIASCAVIGVIVVIINMLFSYYVFIKSETKKPKIKSKTCDTCRHKGITLDYEPCVTCMYIDQEYGNSFSKWEGRDD